MSEPSLFGPTGPDLVGGQAPRATGHVPLADRMRPRTIEEIVGQELLLAPGRPKEVTAAVGAVGSGGSVLVPEPQQRRSSEGGH